jgi:hypothetical protein
MSQGPDFWFCAATPPEMQDGSALRATAPEIPAVSVIDVD